MGAGKVAGCASLEEGQRGVMVIASHACSELRAETLCAPRLSWGGRAPVRKALPQGEEVPWKQCSLHLWRWGEGANDAGV